MAVKYVKDFEFPSAKGSDYSVTGGKTVTGPSAPKAQSRAPQPSDYGWDSDQMDRAERGYKKGGKVAIPVKKAEGGPLVTGLAENEGRYSEATRNARAQRQLKDFRDASAEARWAASQARGSDWADKKNRADTADEQENFARRYADKTATETGYKKGGKVQYEDGGKDTSVSVKDIKSGKVKQSTDADFYGKAKPTKKAAGGGPIKKAGGGDIGIAPPQMASPLQQMAARPRGVPVASRSPMIPQQAAAPGGARIGVGMKRPGQPNVGAIRAALAKAASQANPESAPSMMKKGGKVKC